MNDRETSGDRLLVGVRETRVELLPYLDAVGETEKDPHDDGLTVEVIVMDPERVTRDDVDGDEDTVVPAFKEADVVDDGETLPEPLTETETAADEVTVAEKEIDALGVTVVESVLVLMALGVVDWVTETVGV